MSVHLFYMFDEANMYYNNVILLVDIHRKYVTLSTITENNSSSFAAKKNESIESMLNLQSCDQVSEVN